MDKEKLIAKIMKECEQDGEPVTREEAEEMAEMEIKASGIKRYEKSDTPRKSVKRERKPDPIKRELIETIFLFLDRATFTDTEVMNRTVVNPEKEISFTVGDDTYSVTLTKHRPKKK